jgi:hypothetical protein
MGAEYDAQHTIQDAIDAAQSAAENYADTNKIDKTAIYNNLDRLTPDAVLDARQGKVLDDRLT